MIVSEYPPLSPRGNGFSGILNSLTTDPVHKMTGLESLSLPQFLTAATRRELFLHNRDEVYRTATWSTIFIKEIVKEPTARLLFEVLKSRLEGMPLIELGVGDGSQIARHRRIAFEKLGVSVYRAVDRQKSVKGYQGIQDDILHFLAQQPSNSANLVSFGVFNEPLGLRRSHFFRAAASPDAASRAHFEHEYVHRLAQEVARVIPENGIFFGQGIKPALFENEILISMQRAGLSEWNAAHEAFNAIINEIYRIDDPFCLEKSPA